MWIHLYIKRTSFEIFYFTQVTISFNERLDLFQAVQAVPKDFFAFHDNTNANCPVGENIHNILDQYLANIQEAMNQEMKKTTLQTLFEQTKPYLK